ncbi:MULTISPECIES: PIN-like domain-containing protein [unclassified Streptomyces]|uniref:PIN-like domain-containing protein n=1 Tax=unclassified Streptomyces TaxID=2593676 RepID=UPI000B72F643|nr:MULTISPECIES: PIN-like domain-containing protein [unclassified Streptomyces]MYX03677.1 hypothetical protein [Streptomyces sp. SID8378]SNB85417.1 hypothetical protein SAMN02745831_02531 [Streptomyces sp. PgraA7]
MAAPHATSDQPQDRGIFDCDEAHRSPLRSDYGFDSGLVVLDTNLLLNLYRSNESTQVLTEFWRNRESATVRHHHATKANEAGTALDKAVKAARTAVTTWLTAVQLKGDEEAAQRTDQDLTEITKAADSLKMFIRAQAECDALKETATTHTDPVLNVLEPLLHGRIGEPLPPDEHGQAVKEAQERADEGIPPGHEDFRTKEPELAAGDYLLWVQLMAEARHRGRDVLLVTGDVKKHWWTSRGYDIPPRPRAELLLELREHARVDLYMLTPSLEEFSHLVVVWHFDQASPDDVEYHLPW